MIIRSGDLIQLTFYESSPFDDITVINLVEGYYEATDEFYDDQHPDSGPIWLDIWIDNELQSFYIDETVSFRVL